MKMRPTVGKANRTQLINNVKSYSKKVVEGAKIVKGAIKSKFKNK